MKILQEKTFIRRCITDTLSGIREGLSRFSGESRVAVIYCLAPDDELFILDPQNLLYGYEPKLKEIYLGSNAWRHQEKFVYNRNTFNQIEPVPSLQLDGRVSCGGKSGSVFYQMWFTEHHPDICSTGPTERWLEHAVLRFSHDIADERSLYTGISGGFLREYATHAVYDYIVDMINLRLGLDTRIDIYNILDSVLGISKTPEESIRPHGKLIFIEPRFLSGIEFLARFKADERPKVNHYKHVRKLLQAVEHSDRKLISDGVSLIGIAEGFLPEFHITADFQGKIGFVYLENERICSFIHGSYTSNTYRARLVEVEEALLDYDIDAGSRDSLFQAIVSIVHSAQNKKFGCALVVDLAKEKAFISGQDIDPPIDLRLPNQLDLACSLSKVDGALHLRPDVHLHAFACLLDGHCIEGEDRARGARYNSALRFTAEHPQTIIIVVSADRPVSVIQHGKELQNRNCLTTLTQCTIHPETLEQWLASK